MELSRRTILKGAGALSLVAGSLDLSASAQTAAPLGASGVSPMLFVHGNADHAALWLTTLWRMESNGIPRGRMLAINFADPLARNDDKVAQANRSSTEDQRRKLAVAELKRTTGASRIALVGNSRGGYAIRNYIKNAGAQDVSHVVLCGIPNHGVFDWDDNRGSEFNGRGPFLRGLNEGDREITPGASHLAQRRHGQICAGGWPLRGQARHAHRHHLRRSGAEGRNQSRAGSRRSPGDCVFAACVPQDLQIHCRPGA